MRIEALIDSEALIHNLNLVRRHAPQSKVLAMVKANAYGLGVIPVATAIAEAGCTHFFVATLAEAVELRQRLTSPFIYVFAGVQANEPKYFLEYNLIPVLNDWVQFERWEKAVIGVDAAPSALHVDTGMNRLGFSLDDAEKLALFADEGQAKIENARAHLAFDQGDVKGACQYYQKSYKAYAREGSESGVNFEAELMRQINCPIPSASQP